MDKRRDQRIGKLQNSLEKTYIAEPSIKVIQYGDYHDLLLDKSFKGRNESREDFQEPQFQNNKYARYLLLLNLNIFIFKSLLISFSIYIQTVLIK